MGPRTVVRAAVAPGVGPTGHVTTLEYHWAKMNSPLINKYIYIYIYIKSTHPVAVGSKTVRPRPRAFHQKESARESGLAHQSVESVTRTRHPPNQS